MGEKKPDRIRWEMLALVAVPFAIGAGVWAISASKRPPEVPLAPLTSELLLALSRDPAAVAEGKQLYLTTCVSCHGARGQGLVGPNLTDGSWLHGDQPLQVHSSISQGFPQKGMAAFENLLGPARVRAVTAFVLTLKDTNVPGKAP